MLIGSGGCVKLDCVTLEARVSEGASDPVTCGHEGMQAQYSQISPFLKKSTQSCFLLEASQFKTLDEPIKYGWVWVI